jgi:hypothetical protein
MFYVGIDVAKYKHDLTIINEPGLVIVTKKTIQNSKEGLTTCYLLYLLLIVLKASR